MIIDDEILFKLTELFAGIWGWLMTIAVASFIISGILFSFFKLFKENVFLGVCTLVFMHIGRVSAYISLAAAILMIIPAIPGMLQQLNEMYLR